MIYNPFSVSKFGTYNQCPLKFKYQYIEKIKVPFKYNIALYRGSYAHKIIEEGYFYETEFKTNEIFTEEEKAKAKEMVRKFEQSDIGLEYFSISNYNKTALHEEKFGYKVKDSKLEICSYWDKECWIRGAIDFSYIEDDTIYCADWKTGSEKSQDETFGIEQSKAYSIYLMLKHPELNVVKCRFVFIEHLTEKEIVYTRENLNNYIKDFFVLTKKVEGDEVHKENISALCDYCDYNKEGICTKPEEAKETSDDFMNSKISLDF